MTLKKNQIHQGDCVDLLARLEPGSIDLAFADPPFNIGYEYDVYDDQKSTDDYLTWSRQWIEGVYRTLKPTGTFWLAIGDEYAAELKIESQRAGFHCRSWVIWYYTFGVNCANGFSRSHTHLFHFVKDPKEFTFVRANPQIRVKSARQLVYADNRANPSGRLPDNTWITRPQDAPDAFRPNDDTWFFSRVAGTFKEREGFHGCQMPEQLLARVIRASSNPLDLVLDPFGGSGTTLCVAKKLNRSFVGFELSKEYAANIKRRLKQTQVGDPIDGPEDPIESAPATARGKRKSKQEFDEETIAAVIDAMEEVTAGNSLDQLLCDPNLNKQFGKACRQRGTGGSAVVWNRLLVELRKAGKLPTPTGGLPAIQNDEFNRYAYASEVAWRLIADEFRMEAQSPLSIDDILCCPNTAEYFDQIAATYGPHDQTISPVEYRQAALLVRERAAEAKNHDQQLADEWSIDQLTELTEADLERSLFGQSGVYLVTTQGVPMYAGDAENLQQQLASFWKHPVWQEKFGPMKFKVHETNLAANANLAIKLKLVQQTKPMLNSYVWR